MDSSRQKMEYSGFNWSAAFFGWLVAAAISVLLTALLTAIGVVLVVTTGASNLIANLKSITIVSTILFLVALAISYFAGGYVAGRMSRFDGGRQGFGVWVMALVITLALSLAGAVLGNSFNLLQRLNLPHMTFNHGALTIGGLITLFVALAVTLIAAVAGAKTGERYHRPVDKAEAIDAEEHTVNQPGSRRATTFAERIENDRRNRD
jgi:hypothetical protein